MVGQRGFDLWRVRIVRARTFLRRAVPASLRLGAARIPRDRISAARKNGRSRLIARRCIQLDGRPKLASRDHKPQMASDNRKIQNRADGSYSTTPDSSRTSQETGSSRPHIEQRFSSADTPSDISTRLDRNRRHSSLLVQPDEGAPGEQKLALQQRQPDLAAPPNSYKISMRQLDVYANCASDAMKVAKTGSGLNQQPIIIVEPHQRDVDTTRCDCRGCQFFSGWCCTPCVLLIIMIIIITWLATPGRRGASSNGTEVAAGSTTAAPATSLSQHRGSWLDVF